MVKEGTCNAVFQHSISHLALDGNRRSIVPVAAAFNVPNLLDRLNSCRLRYDIRVRHWSGSSYVLDVSECFKILAKMQKLRGLETCELQEFVKNKQFRSAWLQCVRGCDLAASVVVSPPREHYKCWCLQVADSTTRERIGRSNSIICQAEIATRCRRTAHLCLEILWTLKIFMIEGRLCSPCNCVASFCEH